MFLWPFTLSLDHKDDLNSNYKLYTLNIHTVTLFCVRNKNITNYILNVALITTRTWLLSTLHFKPQIKARPSGNIAV